MPARAPSSFAAGLWKQGFSKTGLTADLRWRWRHVELKDGCLTWSVWSGEGGHENSSGELVPKGLCDLRLTPCQVKIVGATQFAVSPVRGRQWQGLPRGEGTRIFVFDAIGSQMSLDEWCKAIRKHARFGRVIREELALSQVPATAVLPIAFQQIQACGECRGRDEGSGGLPQCAICLDTFDHQSVLARTACGHVFHDHCVRRWVAKRGTCPMCREELGGTRRRGIQPQ